MFFTPLPPFIPAVVATPVSADSNLRSQHALVRLRACGARGRARLASSKWIYRGYFVALTTDFLGVLESQ
ncbi:MAG: hypothetical protein DPW09_07170 [Anaerolineae bacterium]|nr:hypothetical protein [Anaerolineae bacterium]